MATNTYTYPFDAPLQDGRSHTAVLQLPIRQLCSVDYSTCADGWNANLCGNDTPYFQPICAPILGDAAIPEGNRCECAAAELALAFVAEALTPATLAAKLAAVADFVADLPECADCPPGADAFTCAMWEALACCRYGAAISEDAANGVSVLGLADDTGRNRTFVLAFRQIGQQVAMHVCVSERLGVAVPPASEVVFGPNGDIQCWAGFDRYSVANLQAFCTPQPYLPSGCEAADLLYFQFRYPDKLNDWDNSPMGGSGYGWALRPVGNWLVTWAIHPLQGFCQDTDKRRATVQSYVGADERGRHYQGIVINPAYLPEEFYLSFTFNDPDTGPYTVYTEPYRKVQCEKTLLMEGLYNTQGKAAFDCRGNYYGLPTRYLGSPFQYRNSVRLPAEFVWIMFGVEVERPNRLNTTKITNKDVYRLRSRMLPPYVARQVETVIQSKALIVNGYEYTFSGDVERNNDTSNMWALDLRLEEVTECYERIYNCE